MTSLFFLTSICLNIVLKHCHFTQWIACTGELMSLCMSWLRDRMWGNILKSKLTLFGTSPSTYASEHSAHPPEGGPSSQWQGVWTTEPYSATACGHHSLQLTVKAKTTNTSLWIQPNYNWLIFEPTPMQEKTGIKERLFWKDIHQKGEKTLAVEEEVCID